MANLFGTLGITVISSQVVEHSGPYLAPLILDCDPVQSRSGGHSSHNVHRERKSAHVARLNNTSNNVHELPLLSELTSIPSVRKWRMLVRHYASSGRWQFKHILVYYISPTQRGWVFQMRRTRLCGIWVSIKASDTVIMPISELPASSE